MTLLFLYVVVCLFFIGLVGCSQGTDMVEEERVEKSTITWIDKRPGECADKGPADGCAYWSAGRKECVVIMPKDSPDWLVAHEFRHCFGYGH